jgi:hypothetical protein
LQKAFAADINPTPIPTGALQLALTLEYLKEYYQMGLDSGVIRKEVEMKVSQISAHETDHVTF